jgi:glycosyltransferase involved in cell wall biosynthesis
MICTLARVKATVCLPTYNERENLEKMVRALGGHGVDVLVVDDGSRDLTTEHARAAGATVIRHAQNSGKGSALRTGLDQLLAGSHTHVLFIDGDFQHDPDDIPMLLDAAAEKDCDVVLAERAFTKGEMPTARFYSNRIGSRILSAFIGTEVADSQSGFRLIRVSRLRELNLTATGYEIETEMLIKLARHNASLCRVSIAARYQGSRSKLRSFRDTFRTCMLAVRYRYLGG